ncbi:MAG: hypothetical protein A2X86_16685 [Bdellovibrionales bacterium GWA2_49_15]|nr:MAG: hypothetical protein A2X86_16685 [Bdellovibrionales bacterium GWA2_49_15]HAZ14623.1 hypothetical protein [Bdellovibrionales bacterium]
MESMAEKTIEKYLPLLKVKGRRIEIKNLPAFFRNIYNFDELRINENPYLLITVKDKALGPREFKKHGKIFHEKIALPQIWYMSVLHFHKVQRLIQSGVDFIIEGKQVHLPSVNISIRSERQTIRTQRKKINGLGVNILIRQILQGDLSGKNKLELAMLFKVNQMTLGRALEALIANAICSEKKEGVSKFIHFKDRSELWSFLKNNVGSPIQDIIFPAKFPKDLPSSGITALSHMSMLADDEIPTFAIEKKSFNKSPTSKNEVLEEFAKARLELWDREPTLVKDGTINLLDTYLIHKDDEDERVQIELGKLLKKNDLEIG